MTVTIPAGPGVLTAEGWATLAPLFEPHEFADHADGECRMDADFMHRLFKLRQDFGSPIRINSGYRGPSNPWTKRTWARGHDSAHAYGRAADVHVPADCVADLLRRAELRGFTGIGLRQHGPESGRFVHLDDLEPGHPTKQGGVFPRPRVWTYP